MRIESYRELIVALESWMSWENPEAYDFGGMMGILAACLKNLGSFGVEGELYEVANYLEPAELQVLLQLAEYARANPAEDAED